MGKRNRKKKHVDTTMRLSDLHNPDVRKFMHEEIQLAIISRSIWQPKTLNTNGLGKWFASLKEASLHGDPTSLLEVMSSHVNDEDMEILKNLVDTEFNRYYMMGVCRAAIKNEQKVVEIYRAKQVRKPNSDSQAMVGETLTSKGLLDHLRKNDYKTFPPYRRLGVSLSGLSVKPFDPVSSLNGQDNST